MTPADPDGPAGSEGVAAAAVADDEAPDGDGGVCPQAATAIANAVASASAKASVGSERAGFGALTPARGA
jgi:hypothetical protein